MCGIVGFCSKKSAEPWSENLEAAVATLRLRGPDDNGTWLKDGVGLGHTRLSILDLSEHGHQPMLSRTGRYVMVFNGEVYNFRDIRNELAGLGHGFRGNGDSEVILAAFEEWGLSATSRFVGMFAIALWDQAHLNLGSLK
jgi:asparagine synthase (glutamine-hydrolysing)